MLRILWVPIFALAACLATLVPFLWTEYFREQIRPAWTPEMAYSGNLDDQRHIASCYEVGCRDVIATPILACAWREIILEETNRSSDQDVSAANRDCERISPQHRPILERAEIEIRSHFDPAHPTPKT